MLELNDLKDLAVLLKKLHRYEIRLQRSYRNSSIILESGLFEKAAPPPIKQCHCIVIPVSILPEKRQYCKRLAGFSGDILVFFGFCWLFLGFLSLVHTVFQRRRILGLGSGGFTDNGGRQATGFQQLHQRGRRRAKLGIRKSQVAFFPTPWCRQCGKNARGTFWPAPPGKAAAMASRMAA